MGDEVEWIFASFLSAAAARFLNFPVYRVSINLGLECHRHFIIIIIHWFKCSPVCIGKGEGEKFSGFNLGPRSRCFLLLIIMMMIQLSH